MEALWNDQNDNVSTVAQQINSIAKKLTGLNEAIANYERGGGTANDLRDERNLLLDELSGYVDITYANNEVNPSMVDVQIGGIDLVSGTKAAAIETGCAADRIDAITPETAGTNTAIAQAVAGGGSATTEQTDALTALTGELGTYLSISTLADADGVTDVYYDGVSLVSRSETTAVSEAVENDLDTWVALNSNTLTLGGSALSIGAGTVTGGSLYAHLEQISSADSANPGIPYYMGQLNSLAQSIAEGINDIHLTGYTYDTDESTDTSTTETGVYFFNVDRSYDVSTGKYIEYYSKITAGNFSLSDDVTESVWNIAGSSEPVYSDGTTMDAGNSEVASLLYANLAGGGYYGKINGIVGHLAIALDTSESLLDTKESLLNSVDTQRTSVSGVSVDEETTNLIIYQQAYTACARVITAIDEMLDTMIGSMGLVGR
jgi:flagellar hook-associated protein 1 FlgK